MGFFDQMMSWESEGLIVPAAAASESSRPPAAAKSANDIQTAGSLGELRDAVAHAKTPEAAVRAVQGLLKDQGYMNDAIVDSKREDAVDGKFGAKTQVALQHYLEAHKGPPGTDAQILSEALGKPMKPGEINNRRLTNPLNEQRMLPKDFHDLPAQARHPHHAKAIPPTPQPMHGGMNNGATNGAQFPAGVLHGEADLKGGFHATFTIAPGQKANYTISKDGKQIYAGNEDHYIGALQKYGFSKQQAKASLEEGGLDVQKSINDAQVNGTIDPAKTAPVTSAAKSAPPAPAGGKSSTITPPASKQAAVALPGPGTGGLY